MTKTLPDIANPHIRIYREIGQQVFASIEDGWTHTQTDVIELYIRSSDWTIMSKEFKFLRGLFRENGYPDKLFSTCLQKFLSNKFTINKPKLK